jgi:hypothetical protein
VTRIPIEWRPLEPPRTPAAVLATGAAARDLAAAALRHVENGEHLRVAADEETLLVVGGPDQLPWADGSTYLGVDAGLYLPTTQTTSIPPGMLYPSFRSLVGANHVVVLPGQVLGFAISLDPVDPGWLRSYAAGSSP